MQNLLRFLIIVTAIALTTACAKDESQTEEARRFGFNFDMPTGTTTGTPTTPVTPPASGGSTAVAPFPYLGEPIRPGAAPVPPTPVCKAFTVKERWVTQPRRGFLFTITLKTEPGMDRVYFRQDHGGFYSETPTQNFSPARTDVGIPETANPVPSGNDPKWVFGAYVNDKRICEVTLDIPDRDTPPVAQPLPPNLGRPITGEPGAPVNPGTPATPITPPNPPITNPPVTGPVPNPVPNPIPNPVPQGAVCSIPTLRQDGVTVANLVAPLGHKVHFIASRTSQSAVIQATTPGVQITSLSLPSPYFLEFTAREDVFGDDYVITDMNNREMKRGRITAGINSAQLPLAPVAAVEDNILTLKFFRAGRELTECGRSKIRQLPLYPAITQVEVKRIVEHVTPEIQNYFASAALDPTDAAFAVLRDYTDNTSRHNVGVWAGAFQGFPLVELAGRFMRALFYKKLPRFPMLYVNFEPSLETPTLRTLILKDLFEAVDFKSPETNALVQEIMNRLKRIPRARLELVIGIDLTNAIFAGVEKAALEKDNFVRIELEKRAGIFNKNPTESFNPQFMTATGISDEVKKLQSVKDFLAGVGLANQGMIYLLEALRKNLGYTPDQPSYAQESLEVTLSVERDRSNRLAKDLLFKIAKEYFRPGVETLALRQTAAKVATNWHILGVSNYFSRKKTMEVITAKAQELALYGINHLLENRTCQGLDQQLDADFARRRINIFTEPVTVYGCGPRGIICREEVRYVDVAHPIDSDDGDLRGPHLKACTTLENKINANGGSVVTTFVNAANLTLLPSTPDPWLILKVLAATPPVGHADFDRDTYWSVLFRPNGDLTAPKHTYFSWTAGWLENNLRASAQAIGRPAQRPRRFFDLAKKPAPYIRRE